MKKWWNGFNERQKAAMLAALGLGAWAGLLIGFSLLGGCASVKPYLVCKVADGKAQVQQGMMGVGVGQDLPDADSLCGKGK